MRGNDLLDAATAQRLQQISRWSETSLQGGPLNQGDPTKLTWSIVPDGTPVIPGRDEEDLGNSNLQATLDTIYGDRAVWQPVLESVFQRWDAVSGLSYAYEPMDDGAAIRPYDAAPGVVGLRGDVRLAGHAVDGDGAVVAYSYFPPHSDIVFDTVDNSFLSPGDEQVMHRNLLAHEHGHGLGLDHVISSSSTMLMEPFITDWFDGPQFDEILLIQRAYGDPLEEGTGNDSVFTATDLGVIAPGQVRRLGWDARSAVIAPEQTDFVSIDGLTDVDYFRFEVPGRSWATFTLAPLGPTYRQAVEDGTETVLNAASLNDLTLELLSAGSIGVVATAPDLGIGKTEILEVLLPEPGVYSLRVRGSEDLPQLYGLDIRVRTDSQIPGDLTGDSQINALDIDQLASRIREHAQGDLFDVNDDGQISVADHHYLVTNILGVYFGDSNLDGQFNSSDLVIVFREGQYEDSIPGNSGWSSGDWDGNGDFESSDLVLAFQTDGYEKDLAAISVPEPAGPLVQLLALLAICYFHKPRFFHQSAEPGRN